MWRLLREETARAVILEERTHISSRAEQSRAEQSRAEQSRAEQSRPEQSRAEQSRADLVASEKKREKQVGDTKSRKLEEIKPRT